MFSCGDSVCHKKYHLYGSGKICSIYCTYILFGLFKKISYDVSWKKRKKKMGHHKDKELCRINDDKIYALWYEFREKIKDRLV